MRERSSQAIIEVLQSPLSVGEFGAVLSQVFQPSSKTAFEWKEAAGLGDGGATVQVLSYRVDRSNANIVLSQGNDETAVGFHGSSILILRRAVCGG